MSLFADVFKQLTSLQRDSNTWVTGPMSLVVATSLTDDTPKTIDFSATVGHGKKAPKKGKRDDTNCFFLPKKYNKNDTSFREDNIHGIFVRMCHAAGFTVHAEWNKEIQGIKFSCIKGRYHNEEQNKKDVKEVPR